MLHVSLPTDVLFDLTLLFSADLHGNIKQYQNLYKLAVETNSDYILIGGDLNPKNPWKSVIICSWPIKNLTPIM